MQATYKPIFKSRSGALREGESRTINLPFTRVSARAIIVRRRDGAIVGMRHHKGAMLALPGGWIDDGEQPTEAIIRELAEENVSLQGSDDLWQERLTTVYFHGYHELAMWYLFLVDDAAFLPNNETLETRWVQQQEDVWYPLMREKIIMALLTYVPDRAALTLTLG